MNIKKISAFTLSLFILSVLGSALVSATSHTSDGSNPSDGNVGITVNFPNPFRGSSSLFELLTSIINNVLLPVGGVMAVMGFIWSGFMYVLAQGKPTQIAKANKAFLYTSIGTVVLFGSWAIANLIRNTVDQLRN